MKEDSVRRSRRSKQLRSSLFPESDFNKVTLELKTPKSKTISSVKIEFQDEKNEYPKGEEQEKTAKSREPEE